MNNKLSSILSTIAVAVVVFSFSFTAQAGITTNLYLTIPGSNWSLEIGAPGFDLEQRDFSEDGTAARLKAENKVDRIILTAFLEKAAAPGDAKQCREYYWNDAKKSPMKKDDLKMSETGSVALVEYIVKEFRGTQINQKNMNAYLSKNGYWVDVHISKADFKPENEALLQSVVKTVRFNDNFVPSTSECVTWGMFFMSKKNYTEAARCYGKAWEAENKQPTLSHKQQIYLLSDLISACGNSGNVKKAKELSELGLQKEPDYPTFYYDLACSYAEMGDKTQALENLKKASKNKIKLFADDLLPNPSTDSSFQNIPQTRIL